MKGFETSEGLGLVVASFEGKKECPAMKGFETFAIWKWPGDTHKVRRNAPLWRGLKRNILKSNTHNIKRKKECPAMKGFET